MRAPCPGADSAASAAASSELAGIDVARARRGASHPLLVGDMPFGSYEVRVDDAVSNAIRYLKVPSARGLARAPAAP